MRWMLVGAIAATAAFSGADAATVHQSQFGKLQDGSAVTAITLSNGEERGFLNDGDSIILRGCCQRAGQRRVGFGECRGTVLPARSPRAA